MKRLVFLVLLLPFLSPMQSTSAAAGNDLLSQHLDRVRPRRGLVKTSAVLIPLVLREGEAQHDAGGEGPGMDEPFEPWQPVNDKLVTLITKNSRPRFIPAGTLLSGLGRERILSRSVMLIPGEEIVARATRCDLREDDAPEAAEGKTSLGPIAPHAQRKVDLLAGGREPLFTLLQIQMALAGPDAGAKTVRDTMAAKAIEGRRDKVAAKFSTLSGMYGGAVAGHVLFIGLRPVEFILFREPAEYARHASKYLRAAAFSLVLWEQYYGVDPLLVEEVDDRLLIPVVDQILAAHRAGRVRRARLTSKEKGGGDLYRLSTNPKDPVLKFEGRLLIEGSERRLKKPFHLESYQDGKRTVLPTPLAKPGGRPTDAKPDISHGAMTKGYLQRLAARMASRGR